MGKIQGAINAGLGSVGATVAVSKALNLEQEKLTNQQQQELVDLETKLPDLEKSIDALDTEIDKGYSAQADAEEGVMGFSRYDVPKIKEAIRQKTMQITAMRMQEDTWKARRETLRNRLGVKGDNVNE